MENKKLIFLLLILLVLVMTSCRNRHKLNDLAKVKVYTCSMHPQIIRYEPGNCPICGMTLVEKISETAGDMLSGMQNVIGPTFQKFLFSQKTVKLMEKTVAIEIDANGIIAYDTRYINNINSRVSGRIDKLFIKYPFQQITKGQKILEIYSAELLTAQQNLLYLIKNDPGEKDLIESSKEKLRLLGMKEAEINEIANNGKTKYLISVFSDYTGYAVQKDFPGDQNNPGKTEPSMSSGSADNSPIASLGIKEGAYVNRGETIFKVIDNSSVWAILKIELNDYNQVKTGQKVDVFAADNPEVVSEGKVNYIEKNNSNDQKTINVRVYLNNITRKFSIGQLISAKIYVGDHAGKWIPSKSVLDLGKRKIVFLKKDNVFVAKEVATGMTYDGLTEIISGINANDEIASDAQFFVDSESFIKTQDYEK